MTKYALTMISCFLGMIISIQTFANTKHKGKGPIFELPKSNDQSGQYLINKIKFDQKRLVVQINATFKRLCENSTVKAYHSTPGNQIVLFASSNREDCPPNVTTNVDLKLLEIGLVGIAEKVVLSFGFDSEVQKNEYGRGAFIPQFVLEVPATKNRLQLFTTEYMVGPNDRIDLAVQLSEQGKPQMVRVNVNDNDCNNQSKYQISPTCTKRGTLEHTAELHDISNDIDEAKFEPNVSVFSIREPFYSRMFDKHESKLELVFRQNVLTRFILTNLEDDSYLSGIVRRAVETE